MDQVCILISTSYFSIVVKEYRLGVTSCKFGICLREKVFHLNGNLTNKENSNWRVFLVKEIGGKKKLAVDVP